jgi:hypothetical protein
MFFFKLVRLREMSIGLKSVEEGERPFYLKCSLEV